MEGDFDRGWDGVWISEVRITSEGWTATVETRVRTDASHRRVSSVRRRKNKEGSPIRATLIPSLGWKSKMQPQLSEQLHHRLMTPLLQLH
jgi:hypothetical protein